jgi:hypothetical protein
MLAAALFWAIALVLLSILALEQPFAGIPAVIETDVAITIV